MEQQRVDNDFGLVYRWQYCLWCDDAVTWIEGDDGRLYCNECWGLVGSPDGDWVYVRPTN